MRPPKNRKRRWAVLAAFCALLAIAAAGLENRLTLRRYTVGSEKVKKTVRIALLTDLHSCFYGEGQRELLDMVEAQHPDVVLLGGDIVDDVLPEDNAWLTVRRLAARYPTYYVTGNHEYRSGRVETVFLREVFRQAEQSAIIRNAHAVNLGQPPQLANNQGDFFFLCRRDGERTLSTVVELCKTRLPDHMGIPADQIQVLTPTRKGPSGTENLNRCLQAALNPPAADKREIQWGERLFRTGDRIMQTKNNYNVVWEKADGTVGTGMFNGDVGRIVEIDPSGELLVVNFDDRIATYTLDMLNEIDLAYAMTVHKAQGSEYQCVVLAAMPAAPSLMVRGVLYTALTRARELLIVVGDDAAIRAMAANDRQQRRYSGLRWRLAHFADPAER